MPNWFKHEKKLMRSLGFVPTPGSGSGWLRKEDGESPDFLVQLKSTQKSSISVKTIDILQLEQHARESHKIPVFVLNIAGLTLVCVRPEHFDDLVELQGRPPEN